VEQDIRFCKTSDGVQIAYAMRGRGYPLVQALGWASHLEFYLKMPGVENFVMGRLAQDHRVISYDGRGWGLSDRNVKNFDVGAKVRDLEAVVDAAGLETFALLGISEGGPTAITYAFHHPERVSHLILYGSFARMLPPATKEEQELLYHSMMTVIPGWGRDTPEFRAMWTARFMPDADRAMIKWFNELQRVAGSGETVAAVMGAVGVTDVRELLPQIKVPTLVTHARGDLMVPFERGRELAAHIPNARFVPVDSENHIPLPEDPASAELYRIISEFIGDQQQPASGAAPSGLVTILFTDIVGSTDLTQRVGDEKAQEALRRHNSVVRQALKDHGGTEIKHTGDGIMASFASGRRALDGAVAIQRALAEEDTLLVRIGMNAGEPVAEEDDLFGTSVQLAARVCAKAEAGQILVSNVVRELTMGKGFLFADVGDVALKGFEDPVRLYEVRWRQEI
jgi:class 3 adenylate cyclase